MNTYNVVIVTAEKDYLYCVKANSEYEAGREAQEVHRINFKILMVKIPRMLKPIAA